MLWLLLLCQRLLLFNSLSSFGSEAVLQLVSHFREKKWKDFRDYSNKPPTLMFLIDLLKLHSVWNITWPHSLTHRNLFPAGRNIWSVCVSVCVCVCVCTSHIWFCCAFREVEELKGQLLIADVRGWSSEHTWVSCKHWPSVCYYFPPSLFIFFSFSGEWGGLSLNPKTFLLGFSSKMPSKQLSRFTSLLF